MGSARSCFITVDAVFPCKKTVSKMLGIPFVADGMIIQGMTQTMRDTCGTDGEPLWDSAAPP